MESLNGLSSRQTNSEEPGLADKKLQRMDNDDSRTKSRDDQVVVLSPSPNTEAGTKYSESVSTPASKV